MNFGAVVTGSLRGILDDEVKTMQGAARAAVTAGGEKAQAALRAQTGSAALGPRVANAWRLNIYPKGGRRSDNPSAYLFTKAPRIISAFAAGVTISPNGSALWLAVPTPEAVALGFAYGGKWKSRRKWSNVDAAMRRFGNLRFILLKGGNEALLVADASVANTKFGQKFRRLRDGSRRTASVALFHLYRHVRIPKKLDIDAAASAGSDEMFATYAAELSR